MEECGAIPPRQREMVRCNDAGYLAECIRSRAHAGPHAVRLPDGKLVAWEDEMTCGCCEPEEEDRCIVYWEIDEGDLAQMA